MLSQFSLWREERQLNTPYVHSHAEYMSGEDSTAMASTAEQSVSRVERWSAREECKRHQFEEEVAQVASISVHRRIVSIEHCIYVHTTTYPETQLH